MTSACCIKSFAPFRQQEFWVISTLVYLAQFWLSVLNGPMKARLLRGSLAAAGQWVNPDWWLSTRTHPWFWVFFLWVGWWGKLAYLSIFTVVWRICNLILKFRAPKDVISPNVKKIDLSAGASPSRVAPQALNSTGIMIKTSLIASTQTLNPRRVFAGF